MPGSVQKSACSPTVVPLKRFEGDDAALVTALTEERAGAMEALYDRYAFHVQRVLARVVGIDAALPDMLHEVFIEAFTHIGSLKDPGRLKAWLTSIAVFTARGRIRKRSRRLALWFSDSTVVPDVSTPGADHETREALKNTYEILDRMPADERIAFTLRFMEGMELTEVADASRVSLATIKRRLTRAQRKFCIMAERQPILREWLDRGERWRVE